MHPLVREAVYADLAAGERDRLHRAAARLLSEAGSSPDRVAAHLLAVEPRADAWAQEALHSAGLAAAADGDPAGAARYLGRALAEQPPAPRRGEILFALGLAENAFGADGTIPHLEEALALATDDATRTLRAAALSGAHVWLGDGRAAADVLERALGQVDDPDLAQQLEATLIAALTADGELLPLARRRLARYRAEDLGDRASDLPILCELALDASMRGEQVERAVELAERSVANWHVLAETGLDSPAVTFALNTLTACERLERAAELWGEIIDDASRKGSVGGYALGSCFRSVAALRLGRLAEAETDAWAAIELSDDERLAVQHDHALVFLIWTLLEQGQVSAAEEALAGGALVRGEWHSALALVEISRGLLAMAKGDARRALEHLLHGGRRWAEFIANPAWVPWRSQAALAHAALEQHGAARALLEEELELARAFGAPGTIGVVLGRWGLIEGGSAGIELLRDAVAHLERSELALEHARALVDLGAVLRRAGLRAEARDQLRGGLEMAHRFGAVPLVERAQEELAAAGARRRSPYATGRDALTASELRVAGLAVSGMTNREIAQSLFVTRKTVETHLSHAYSKLDISSRDELARALHEPPPGAEAPRTAVAS